MIRHRHPRLWVGAALLLAGCTTTATTPAPSPAATPGTTPTAVAVATPTPSPTLSPSASPTHAPTGQLLAPLGYHGTGTIAFARPDPAISDTATWLVNPDGTHETPLRVVPVSPSAPRVTGGCCAVFSPHGTQVAVGFAELDPYRAPDASLTATVLDLHGSVAHRIPGFCGGCGSIVGVDYVPRAWSPDGRNVAVEVWSDAVPTRDGLRLSPVTTDDDWGQSTRGQRDVPVAFSPDGTKLLFVRVTTEDQSGSLMVFTVADGAVLQVSPPGMLVFASDYFGAAASWAPDSTHIAFAATDASGDTGQMSAFVARADGSDLFDLRSLAGPTSFMTTAQWSPNGTWIAFDRPTSGHVHDEFIVHPDDSGLTNLTATFTPGVCCARWAPDSSALLVAGTATTDDQSYLLIIPVNGGPIAQVTTVPALYESFSWGRASR